MLARRPRRVSRLAAFASLVVAAVLSLASTGCGDHLVGLHDVALRFSRDTTGAAPGGEAHEEDVSGEALRQRVAERLASVDIVADIDTPGAVAGQVTVRVDEDFAGEVERLLSWQGGLTIGVVDERTPEAASDTSDASHAPHVRLVREILRSDVGRARGLGAALAMAWPPLAEADAREVLVDGPRVLVPLSPEAEAAVAAVARDAPAARVVVARDLAVVAVLTPPVVRDHRLVVPLGKDIVAYTLAADLARLLETPRLPHLRQTSRANADPDWFLAAGNVALPLAVSLAWLFFVRRFDRAQPEPLWLVGATFGLGALAVIPAGLVEWGWDSLSPYTNATLLTLGRSPRAFPIALVGFVVTVGVTEEACKLLATWLLAAHRREFDEPVDGIVYGAAAALGFAAAENFRYLGIGRVAGALVASRAFVSVPAHLFFGTIWGYALGRRLLSPTTRVWPLFLAAVTLHGLFDTCLSIDGGLPWGVLVGLVVASIFMVHLRLALRHGAILPGSVPRTADDPRGRPELFRMGSRAVFVAFIGATYLLSGAVFFLTLVEHSGRAGLTLGAVSAVTLGLLGWSARGVAATLPLDVVVDDTGVTFAGAAVLYRDVLRIERQRLAGSLRRQEQMLIVGKERRLVLGPASHATIDALSHALAMRLSSVALRS